MNISSWRQVALISCFALSLVVIGCSDDETPPVIEVVDFEVTIDENQESGTILGTLEATTNKGALSFQLKSESVTGAFSVNATTGELSALDGTKFDFETTPILTAVVLAVNGKVESEIAVKVNLQKIIWEGEDVVFAKASSVDWTLAANQDKITDKIIFTRQDKGPIYNYQWWQDTFDADATYDDLYDDFWNEDNSERIFTRQGGTNGVRWTILDDTGSSTTAWGDFDLYGTLGDPTHFYSFHNIATIITRLEDDENVIGIVDDFHVELNEEGTASGTDMTLLIGKKLGVWLVEEDIYFTLTFTAWGSGGENSVSYSRSTKD